MDFALRSLEKLRSNPGLLISANSASDSRFAMTVIRHFAQGNTALDEHMDALLEILAELLAEPQDPAATGIDNQGARCGLAFKGRQSHPCGGEQPGIMTEPRCL